MLVKLKSLFLKISYLGSSQPIYIRMAIVIGLIKQ
uniref:Uncharacterized protein n=1 Tax=Arundo donax TaxID=35708 RepID=A0A0A8ZSQ9_ARUDO